METDKKNLTPSEGRIIGANHGKRVDLSPGKTAIVIYNHYNEIFGSEKEKDQISLVIQDMRSIASGLADQECVEIARRYFPECFV